MDAVVLFEEFHCELCCIFGNIRDSYNVVGRVDTLQTHGACDLVFGVSNLVDICRIFELFLGIHQEN